MVEHTRIEYAAYFFNQFMQAVVGVMEENLKEEIEFWQFLIDEAEKCGDTDSITRLMDARNLAEYKLRKRRTTTSVKS